MCLRRCRSPEFAFVCLWFLIAIEVAQDFFYLLFPLIQVLFWSSAARQYSRLLRLVSETSFLYFANECWILGFCSYLIKVSLKLFQMARFFKMRYTYTPSSSCIKDYVVCALENFITVFYKTIFMFFMSCMTKMAVLAVCSMCRFGLCGCTEIVRFLNKTDHFMFIALVLMTTKPLPWLLLLINSMVMIWKWFVVLHFIFPLCSL